jgi:hypothetical protein
MMNVLSRYDGYWEKVVASGVEAWRLSDVQ